MLDAPFQGLPATRQKHMYVADGGDEQVARSRRSAETLM
jgi:hypothetical protein